MTKHKALEILVNLINEKGHVVSRRKKLPYGSQWLIESFILVLKGLQNQVKQGQELNLDKAILEWRQSQKSYGQKWFPTEADVQDIKELYVLSVGFGNLWKLDNIVKTLEMLV